MSIESQAQRVRTVSQTLDKFKTSKELYEALIKQTPDFKGKLKFQTLYAPREYIIRTKASEIPSLLKSLSGLGQKAVHLEGPGLSVRNVPTNVPPSKIQITLQTELPEIVFLDLFPPNQGGALHRGVGKLYVVPDAWTEDAHADFRMCVTPTEIEEPCIIVQHQIDELSHLGPMYVRKWTDRPRRPRTQSVAISKPSQNSSRGSRMIPSPSPDIQKLQQKMLDIAAASANQFEIIEKRQLALHQQLLTRMDIIENSIKTLSADVTALNGIVVQAVETLGRNTQMARTPPSRCDIPNKLQQHASAGTKPSVVGDTEHSDSSKSATKRAENTTASSNAAAIRPDASRRQHLDSYNPKLTFDPSRSLHFCHANITGFFSPNDTFKNRLRWAVNYALASCVLIFAFSDTHLAKYRYPTP